MAAALLCVACSSSGDAAGPPGQHGTDGPAASPAAAPTTTGRPTVPPQLRECGRQPAPPPLDQLSWSAPDGFATAGGFTQIAPLEEEYTATYLTPESAGAGVEVLVVVHYPNVPDPLTDECGQVDRKRVDAYLSDWHESAGITTSASDWTEVAGLPAVHEVEHYTGRSFTVDSTIVVGRGELLMVSCQWTDQEDVIRAGCAELLGSMTAR